MRQCRVPLSDHARCACGALGLLLAFGSFAQHVVDGASVQKALAEPAVQETAQRLNVLAERKATNEIVAELERMDPAAAPGTIAHEWLLDRGLHTLATLEPTPAAYTFAARIAQHPPQVFARLDPDHGSHIAPLYDPGATARFVLRNWERAAARDRTATALSAQQSWPIERFEQGDFLTAADAARAGIADAFKASPIDALARQRDAIIASFERGAPIDELAAITAERLRDADLYRLVLGGADAAVALGAVRSVRALGDATALDVLAAASRRSDIASACVLEIGRIAREDPRARAELFDMLADRSTGPSAAAALAALREAEVVADLGRRLTMSASESERTHAALALKLNGSPPARMQLERFVKTSSGSARLRKEVRAWLAR